MWIKIFVISAVVVFASLANAFDSFGVTSGDDARADVCSKLGPQCSEDRKAVLICTELGKPGKLVRNCEEESGMICHQVDGKFKCVEPPSSKPVKYKCSSGGEFPDPLDCTQTYKCSPGKEYPIEQCHCAGNGFVYPDEKGNHPCYGLGECPRQEIVCEEGMFGEFTVNGVGTGVCYYCFGKDMSTSYKCGNYSNTGRLVHLEKICVKLEEPPTTKPTQPPTTKPRPPECEPPKCTDARCFYWRYNAECDCFYYECDRRMIPIKHACPYGWHYVHKLQRCVRGLCDRNCPDCD